MQWRKCADRIKEKRKEHNSYAQFQNPGRNLPVVQGSARVPEKKPVHDGVAATASTPEVCQRLKMAQHPLTESVPLKIRQGW